MSQNIQNTQNLICKAGGTQPLAAGKQLFRIKFGMTGMLSTTSDKVLLVLLVL